MRLGISEVVGWALTLIGLLLVLIVVYLAMNRYVFEAMALSLPAVIVFRGGLGMVRMATAGKIASGVIKQENRADST